MSHNATKKSSDLRKLSLQSVSRQEDYLWSNLQVERSTGELFRMSLSSIAPRAALTPETIHVIETAFLALATSTTDTDGKGATLQLDARLLPRFITALGFVETDTVVTVAKSEGLFLSFETLLQIACQALDSTPDWGAEEAKELFAMFDADHDGLLEPFEVQKMLNTLGEPIETLDVEDQVKAIDRRAQQSSIAANLDDFTHCLTKNPVSTTIAK